MVAKKKAAMPQPKNLTPPSTTGVPSRVPANPATKGSATGIQKKAAGMAKRTANRPTAPGTQGKLKKKAATPAAGAAKKGMYW